MLLIDGRLAFTFRVRLGAISNRLPELARPTRPPVVNSLAHSIHPRLPQGFKIGRAQAITDASTDVVTAEGELDAARYGGLLQARGLVDLRGAGLAHSGTYYVKRVTHSMQLGTYKQRFTLTREGTGAMKPLVVP